MKRIFFIGIAISVVVSFLASSSLYAINVLDQGCSATGGASATSAVCQQKNESVMPTVKKGVELLIYALGIVTVIVIIIGGFKYTTSNGDSTKVKSAKDTIMYGVIGLVVALLAFAIVNFVLGRI